VKLGVQTAIVVGAGQSVHTDRDHRIKVQFHWQRSEQLQTALTQSAHAQQAKLPQEAAP